MWSSIGPTTSHWRPRIPPSALIFLNISSRPCSTFLPDGSPIPPRMPNLIGSLDEPPDEDAVSSPPQAVSSPAQTRPEPHQGAGRPGYLEEIATIDRAGTGGVIALDCGVIIFVLHACSSRAGPTRRRAEHAARAAPALRHTALRRTGSAPARRARRSRTGLSRRDCGGSAALLLAPAAYDPAPSCCCSRATCAATGDATQPGWGHA